MLDDWGDCEYLIVGGGLIQIPPNTHNFPNLPLLTNTYYTANLITNTKLLILQMLTLIPNQPIIIDEKSYIFIDKFCTATEQRLHIKDTNNIIHTIIIPIN